MAQTYINSYPIDTSNIPSIIFRLPARIHKESQLFDEASIDAISRYATPGSREYIKALYRHSHPFGNMYALWFPETKVEKIVCLVQVLEYLFIHDDMAKEMAFEDAQREHAQFLRILLGENEERNEISDSTNVDPKERCLRELRKDMLTVDPLGIPAFLDAIKQYLMEYDSTAKNFKTLEEYIPHRIENVGARTGWVGCQWAMGFRFSNEELDLVRDLERSQGTLLALINDYYSWNKEKNEHTDRIRNAVPVLMQQYALDEEQAMKRLKDIIFDEEERAKKLGDEICRTCHPTDDIVKYVNALELRVSGIAYWSATCPRYNREELGEFDLDFST